MSKVKKIALAAAFALAVLAAFRQTQLARDAHTEAQKLREDEAQSARQIADLQGIVADKDSRLTELLAETSRLKSNPNESELLKLRGEVTRLRPLQDDVVALQKMLQQNSAGLPTWKTNELANVGRANPLDALQTYLCFSQQTNIAEIQNSIVGDDLDPVSAEALQHFINNDTSFGNVTGYKISSETWLAPNKVQVELSASFGNMGISVPLTLKNVNGEWKLVLFNIRDADGKVNDVRFFNESL